jgi:competence protein ComEC
MRTIYHRPLIPLTLALMGGIVVGAEAPGLGGWALAAAAACALAMGRSLLRRAPVVFAPLFLVAALGTLSIQPWIQPRLSDDHVARLVDTGPRRITGVVDARPLEFESRTRFVLRVERVDTDGGQLRVGGLLRVTLNGEMPAPVEQGDRIEIRSRIRPVRNFNNPGGFDARRRMGYQDIWCNAFADAAGLVVLEKHAQTGFMGAVDRVRSAIARVIDQAGLGPEGPVLKALVMGDASEIPADVRQAFTRTGTSHILAISGLHISLVATASFALFRWGLCRVPGCLRRAWTRKGAALLTLAPVAGYALIAGFSPSTQRAFIMVVVFLAALLAERETDFKNSMALAALAILAVHPPSLFSVSFQLSFAAVFSIVYGMDWLDALFPTSRLPVGRAARIRRWVGMSLAVSACATWGTLPICLYYFNLASFSGLLANCVVIPLMGYLSVGLGLVGALAGAVSVPAAVACHAVNGVILAWTIAFIQWMAAMPYAAVRTVTPSPVEIGLFYAATGAGLSLVLHRRAAAPSGTRPSEPAPAGRARAAIAVMAACLIVGAADVGYWVHQRFWRNDLRVTALDVGQGNAVLVELPGGHTLLVDGGGTADRATFDVGAAVVAPFLWRNKIRTIDTLVLTHANSDHVNGMIFIAETFRVGSLWAASEDVGHAGYAELLRVCEARGVARPRFADLARDWAFGPARVEVLHPSGDATERRPRDENNRSLVTRISLGGHAILLPGDIMHAAEKGIVRTAGDRLRSSVLLAPHHGSRTSSSEEFLKAVAPETVLISCGGRPGSGMPHPGVLERYRAQGARIWRTDRDGALQVVTDGRRLSVASYLSTADASVSPHDESADD